MTFMALLTKELRLRLRRERSIWAIIIYLFVLGLLGFLFLQPYGSSFSRTSSSQVGGILYGVLAVVQLILIGFISPAFTSTTINSEKERQTFDLLLCSRLSSFSLLAAKLLAGLATVFLLIAASAPFFSLIFFFGGVAPLQFLSALLVFSATALQTGMFGLFFSTVFRRSPVSTALTYVTCVGWMIGPWVIAIFLRFSLTGGRAETVLLSWNPITAIVSTLITTNPFGVYNLGSLSVAPWIVYIILDVVVSGVLFLLCMRLLKPVMSRRRPQKLPKASASTVQGVSGV